jgi:hypothetical protein
MVSNPGGTTSSRETADQTPVRRQPLKRRSLSQFYFSKSQSFNCMQDLLKNSAFSRSTLLLAKRSHSQKHQLDPSFGSISEDDSDCTSPRVPTPQPAEQQQSPFSDCRMQRLSWDGSHSSCTPQAVSCCMLTSLSAADHQQHQQQLQPPLHLPTAQQQWPQPIPVRPSAWHAPLGADAQCQYSSSMAENSSSCWSAPGSLATDSLCAALQSSSLSPPHGLLGVGVGILGFPEAAAHHNLVMVGAASDMH